MAHEKDSTKAVGLPALPSQESQQSRRGSNPYLDGLLERRRSVGGLADAQPGYGPTAVMFAMAQQGKLYAEVEDWKKLISSQILLENCFATLDPFNKRYILDTDLWQLMHGHGISIPFSSICSLYRELKHTRSADPFTAPDRLNLRELGEALFLRTSPKYCALRTAITDDEARLFLHQLRELPGDPLPAESHPQLQREEDKDSLFKLIEITAKASEEHERLRSNLVISTWESYPYLLATAFDRITRGKEVFVWDDLKYVMSLHGVFPTDDELDCLWLRYSGGALETPFGRYCNMLRPFDASEDDFSWRANTAMARIKRTGPAGAKISLDTPKQWSSEGRKRGWSNYDVYRSAERWSGAAVSEAQRMSIVEERLKGN